MLFDFSRGHPNRSLLPVNELQQLMLEVSSSSSSSSQSIAAGCLEYGQEEGALDFVQALAAFQDRHTQHDQLHVDDVYDDDAAAVVSVPSQQPPPPPQAALPLLFAFETNEFFVTEGVSHGIELLCATQLQAGDIVLVERPTYFLIHHIFQSHRLDIQPLPMKKRKKQLKQKQEQQPTTTTTTTASGTIRRRDDEQDDDDDEDGVDVQRLKQMLERNNNEIQRPRRPKMIYIIPIHQNPTAHTMSIHDRHALAALAVQYDILVVADEVYHLLDWRQHGSIISSIRSNNHSCAAAVKPRPARMAQVGRCYDGTNNNNNNQGALQQTRRGCCVSVSSFTKIFAPGIRCGWIEGPPHIIQSLKSYGYIRSQGGCSPVVGALMRCALSPYGIADQVLAKLNNAYGRRSQKLCQGLLSRRCHNNDINNDNDNNDNKNSRNHDNQIQIIHPPLGGYFVWVRFPSEIESAADFLTYCLDHNNHHHQHQVKFLPGSRCDPFHQPCVGGGDGSCRTSSNHDNDHHCCDDDDVVNEEDHDDDDDDDDDTDFSLYARLCFADMDEDCMEQGVATLMQYLEQFLLDKTKRTTQPLPTNQPEHNG